MGRNYRALQIISIFYKFMGGVVLIGGTAFAIITMLSPAYMISAGSMRVSGTSFWSGAIIEISVLITGIGLLAFGQLLDLMMDLE
ncbi:MAG: hypothetical protein JNJ78_09135, partial [Anaerolineae bacterium]|nr:hypothetical protein [Anaerolineae bacterium]